jgi:NTP pyrophosphatase (non-canonical NTP hydrolase)
VESSSNKNRIKMSTDEYQSIINETAVYPKDMGIAYCTMGLTDEAGEVAGKIKKLFRDKDLHITGIVHEEDKQEIAKELGDVLWYITALANELDLSLNDIMEMNYNKLTKRKETGTLKGSGDNR